MRSICLVSCCQRSLLYFFLPRETAIIKCLICLTLCSKPGIFKVCNQSDEHQLESCWKCFPEKTLPRKIWLKFFWSRSSQRSQNVYRFFIVEMYFSKCFQGFFILYEQTKFLHFALSKAWNSKGPDFFLHKHVMNFSGKKNWVYWYFYSLLLEGHFNWLTPTLLGDSCWFVISSNISASTKEGRYWEAKSTAGLHKYVIGFSLKGSKVYSTQVVYWKMHGQWC